MQEASVLGFIKTLIYIIAIYYVIKFLARLFFPILVKKVVQKTEENFQKQQPNHQNYSWQKTANTDKIIIDTTNAKKSRETKKVGEYVNYEEID